MKKFSDTQLARILLVVGFSVSIAFSDAIAQQPLFLSNEIPLDVEAIYQELEPEQNYTTTTQDIIRQLTSNHYSEIKFNDEFSSKLLDSFIKTLDGSRIYFMQADIDEFEQYRTMLDDMLLEGDVEFGYLIFNRYRERLMERLVFIAAEN